ncbi:MAG: hypothetical protein IPL87_02110 [Candidatus Moraniibacteriota bacterium]|nr:MAG: hypothetical protein IPL87_02110 [Candidatus Moranbacteria bacterium]
MSPFGIMRNASTPDPHGKVRSDAERKAAIRRAESELSLLSSDRLKVERRTSDRNLLLRKSREDLRRIQGDIERLEREAKKMKQSFVRLRKIFGLRRSDW